MSTDPYLDQVVEAAYATHGGPMIRWLTSVTRDGTVAEDLVQEAFVRLVTELQAGRGPDDVGAWLHRVAHNLAMSRGRRLSVADRHRRELVLSGDVPSPEITTLEAEAQRAVGAALSALAPTDQRALMMAAYGYTGPEIAASIGRTEGATRTLMCRARAKVRERMQALDSSFAAA